MFFGKQAVDAQAVRTPIASPSDSSYPEQVERVRSSKQ
jgi:hypothetical protein